MKFFKKTHEQNLTIETPQEYLGKSKQDILESLQQDVPFILDSWYLHVPSLTGIESWLVMNNRCTSYLRSNLKGEVQEHVAKNSTIGAIHQHWLQKQTPELQKIQITNNK